MQRLFKTIFIFAIITWLSISCNTNERHKYKEGKLVYQITYLVPREKNPLVIIMPKTMVIYFNRNYTYSTMEGFFGTFKFDVLTDFNNDKKYFIMKIFDKFYVYETDIDDLPLGFDSLGTIQITFLDTSFKYKNLTCHLAKVYNPKIYKDTFDVIYTNEIAIDEPNKNTPFENIPGVIIKTHLNFFHIPFVLELKELNTNQVNSQIFTLPENYHKISRQEMEHIIKNFMK